MALLFATVAGAMLMVTFAVPNPCVHECPPAIPQQCNPVPIVCPPQLPCLPPLPLPPPPPPICPLPLPCPVLPPLLPLPQLPCPNLCPPIQSEGNLISLQTQPALFAENSCCTACRNPCSFRSRKRREVGTRAFERAAENLKDDPVCNNAVLRNIIKENLVDDVWSAKEMLQKAIRAKFPSTISYNIVCATGDLAYTAHTHDFCLVQHNNVSCYVFRPF
ncbi:unnamed protein product [Thelazia callipaeda]|uniref:Ground-like domain-containing protein n=1 Tax=Thelazia callipaeda TaxID=103827 RepID=A0A0N5D9B7_THECL|nr:unnamed protein product [Thelazia callipaeda]